MNERIHELYKQAHTTLEQQVRDGSWDNDREPYLYRTVKVTNFDYEKFAELIVRECIDCARGAGLADDVAVRNKLGFNDGISEAITHMKKHFGVEE